VNWIYRRIPQAVCYINASVALLALASMSSVFAQNAMPPTAPAPRNIIVSEPPVAAKPKATGEIGTNNVTWQTAPAGIPRAIYKEGVEYPGLRFEAGKAYAQTDWSGAGVLALDVKNPGSEAVEIYIRVDDSETADGNRHSRTGGVRLAPGERADVLFMLDAAAPGMHHGPPFPVQRPRYLTNIYGDGVQSSNIVSFQIFMLKADKPRALDFYSIRWMPSQDMKGIVDKFGQFTRSDWPGKLKSEAEFAPRAAAEKEWLAKNPPATDRDEFGGWKNGPQLKATGFFRTALVRGGREIEYSRAAATAANATNGARWWLVTPRGRLFWSVGMDVINSGEVGPIRGREAMFTELPEEARNSGNTYFYRWNLERKYGADTDKRWPDVALSRLQSWGFNTIGNWSSSDLFRTRRVPYVSTFGTPGDVPRLGDYGMFDYFDDAFRTAIRRQAEAGTREWKNDPWCLGYFVDNEITWDPYRGAPAGVAAAAATLNTPSSSAAHRAFAKILQEKYATPEAWSRAWGIDAKSFEATLQLDPSKFNAAAQADASLFFAALARQYYSTVRDAMREYAPNQLYLGSRFAPKPREAVAAAAQYCDVISFNIYKETLADSEYSFLSTLGKPIIIGEFHFGALDRGLFSGGLVPRASQAERARAYDTYVRSALARPEVVGVHWFQYIDEPLTGRFDGENHNIGFVDVTDTPYPEMRAAARRVNNTIYQSAGGKQNAKN
jgi:hypothetical protein